MVQYVQYIGVVCASVHRPPVMCCCFLAWSGVCVGRPTQVATTSQSRYSPSARPLFCVLGRGVPHARERPPR
eukprot:5029318-Prymnesium_polylepis.1